ncbi:two-partner secretion system transporter TpsB2 [Noviherbaspirillum agri]
MRHHLSRLVAGAALILSIFPAAADEQDAVGRFEITGFSVQGNTLLSDRAVEALLAPYTGKNRNFGHVQMALEALERAYQRLGYNVVQVVLPEQELNQGVVQLRVVEAKLGKVRVQGNRTFDEANIRQGLPGLQEGQTPNIADVSSSLKLVNENPAKKVTLQLQSGAQEDEVDATLKVVDDKPWKIGATVDNNGTEVTGDTYLTVQYQHANIAGRDHVLGLQYTTTIEEPSRVNVYGLGYHIPLYSLGDSVDLYASYSDVDSGAVLAGIVDLQVSGKGAVYGVRYNHNLRRAGDYESKLMVGLDYKAYRNNVLLQGIQLGNDVTVHPLSVAYVGGWTLPRSEISFSLAASHNVPGGDKGDRAAFNLVRAGADSSYDILRYSAAYAHALPNDWQGRVSFSGQYSSDRLIPGEQFGAGGASTVRGFQERDISNDVGHLLSAELYTPNLCTGIERVTAQCRALAFYDTARVRRNDPLPGESARASIGSVGLGWRMTIEKNMSLQMDYAQVVDAGGSEGKADKRLHVKLGVTY